MYLVCTFAKNSCFHSFGRERPIPVKSLGSAPPVPINSKIEEKGIQATMVGDQAKSGRAAVNHAIADRQNILMTTTVSVTGMQTLNRLNSNGEESMLCAECPNSPQITLLDNEIVVSTANAPASTTSVSGSEC
jgi:hypothetical protein